MRPSFRQPRRVIAGCCAGLGLGVWMGFVALSVHYSFTRPHQPDPSTGRVYEHNMHGSYTYLTRREQWWLWFLEAGGIGFFVAGVAVGRKRTPGYEEVRATYKTGEKSNDGA